MLRPSGPPPRYLSETRSVSLSPRRFFVQTALFMLGSFSRSLTWLNIFDFVPVGYVMLAFLPAHGFCCGCRLFVRPSVS